MPTPAEIFLNEHQVIERELIELETIMNSEQINYPNLIHVLRKLNEFWDDHEIREDQYFHQLHGKGFTVPIRKISFEHGKLKTSRDHLLNAIKSGSEYKTKEALRRDGKYLIDMMRKHMAGEDWIFYALPKSTLSK